MRFTFLLHFFFNNVNKNVSMNTKEIWKDIPEYEGLYQVSNHGNVKRLSRITISRGRKVRLKTIILRPGITEGYEKVVLTKKGNKSGKKVHRLVAQAFIPNLENKPCVNHIDFNGCNNRLENLEWCTILENVRHSRAANRYPKTVISKEHREAIEKSVSKKVINIESGEVYKSAKEAATIYNIKKSTLIHYLLGTRRNKTTLRYLKLL